MLKEAPYNWKFGEMLLNAAFVLFLLQGNMSGYRLHRSRPRFDIAIENTDLPLFIHRLCSSLKRDTVETDIVLVGHRIQNHNNNRLVFIYKYAVIFILNIMLVILLSFFYSFLFSPVCSGCWLVSAT